MAKGQPLVRVDTRGLAQFKRDADAFDKAIIRDLKKAVKRIAERGVAAETAALRETPPTGGSMDVGSRDAVIRGTRVSFSFANRSAGARIVSAATRLDVDHKGFLRAYNTRSFRHKVFGRDVWVSQTGRPYFAEAIAPALDRVAVAEIEAALEAAMRAMGAK
jgi:hypothetical protein